MSERDWLYVHVDHEKELVYVSCEEDDYYAVIGYGPCKDQSSFANATAKDLAKKWGYKLHEW